MHPLDTNIDVYKLAALPNPKNSELLKNMAQEHGLTDPFRVIHPFQNSYTYSPFGSARKNRSRLDFFCNFKQPLTFSTGLFKLPYTVNLSVRP